MTDIELSKKIHCTIYEEYRKALDIITINPDYSLVIFRNILSHLCQQIATYNYIELNETSLDKKIKKLFEKKLINTNLKDLFHKARKLGNKGAHKNYEVIEDDTEYLKEIQKQNLEDANNARLCIVNIFKEIVIVLDITTVLDNIHLTIVEDAEYKQTLNDAVITESSKIKLNAGIIYESLAANEYKKNFLIIPQDDELKARHFYQLALSYYQSSYTLSIDVVKLYHKYLGKLTTDEILYKYCDLEALYKYSKLLCENKDGSNREDLGFKILKIASDRKYPNATAEYAIHLYEDLKDYNTAYKYLKLDYIQNIPLTHRILSHYYSAGNATKMNKDLALTHIKKAIELGCSDSLFRLGEAYHKGSFVDKDRVLAEKYLLKAIKQGHFAAKRYYFFEFNNGIEEIAKEVSSRFSELRNSPLFQNNNTSNSSTKIGRNEICNCGSGKKYKRCCLLK